MPARTGKDYIESLKRMKPTIYLNGRLVCSTTPATATSLFTTRRLAATLSAAHSLSLGARKSS